MPAPANMARSTNGPKVAFPKELSPRFHGSLSSATIFRFPRNQKPRHHSVITCVLHAHAKLVDFQTVMEILLQNTGMLVTKHLHNLKPCNVTNRSNKLGDNMKNEVRGDKADDVRQLAS